MLGWLPRLLTAFGILVMPGCTVLVAQPESGTPAFLTTAPLAHDFADAEADITGPPSPCTPDSARPTRIEPSERLKHWISVGMVTTAIYFMAHAWLKKDPRMRIGAPGTGEPSHPCADPNVLGRPFWCDLGGGNGR
jgi:hypothetical protein